ncbi:putative DNA binding protein [Phage f2b1]|nr:putative DNA binding protein [Phage f2b1]
MLINREELARQIALRGSYKIRDVDEVIKLLEEVIADAVEEGHTVKIGKLLQIYLDELPRKEAYDGLNKRYFIREAKKVPKVQLLKRLKDIEVPVNKEEEG